MDLQELLAREAIRDLVARYNANGDSGRFEQVMELFTDDAFMAADGTEYRGKGEILTLFTGASDQVKSGGPDGSSGPTPSYIRHFTATHQIDIVDEHSATGRAYFAVLSPVGLDHWGRYVDTYQVVDGRWLFASRIVTTDDMAPDSVFQTGD